MESMRTYMTFRSNGCNASRGQKPLRNYAIYGSAPPGGIVPRVGNQTPARPGGANSGINVVMLPGVAQAAASSRFLEEDRKQATSPPPAAAAQCNLARDESDADWGAKKTFLKCLFPTSRKDYFLVANCKFQFVLKAAGYQRKNPLCPP